MTKNTHLIEQDCGALQDSSPINLQTNAMSCKQNALIEKTVGRAYTSICYMLTTGMLSEKTKRHRLALVESNACC